MIRRLEKSDLEEAVSIWLDANLEAHGFIAPSYWQGHREEVRTALAQAEGWAFAEEERLEILGFVGLQGDYIAGIFVRRDARSRGVGRQLLDRVKTDRRRLQLRVYRKNERAAAFYRREGFHLLEEGTDLETGEDELLLEWRPTGPAG